MPDHIRLGQLLGPDGDTRLGSLIVGIEFETQTHNDKRSSFSF
jgi:hypothetical protein